MYIYFQTYLKILHFSFHLVVSKIQCQPGVRVLHLYLVFFKCYVLYSLKLLKKILKFLMNNKKKCFCSRCTKIQTVKTQWLSVTTGRNLTRYLKVDRWFYCIDGYVPVLFLGTILF